MQHPSYSIFLAIGFQVWTLASLWWMIYWRSHARRKDLNGWRAAPIAFAPFALLATVCIAGAVRMVLDR
jgi:hypothetical protein